MSLSHRSNEEIERLTKDVERAREKAEAWDKRNIWMLIAAGTIAVGLAVCGMRISFWNKEVLRTSANLNQAKDREVALAIQGASDKASKANERAGDAGERAAKLENEAAVARTKQAKAQKESAEAQLALKQYIEEVAKRQGRRMITDHKPFLAALENKPKAKVILAFKQNDSEAYLFALMIRRWLGDGDHGDGAGWEVTEPTSFITDVGVAGSGGSSGLSIFVRNPNLIREPNSAVSALIDAFSAGSNTGGGFVISGDPNLPDGVIKLLVGQKP